MSVASYRSTGENLIFFESFFYIFRFRQEKIFLYKIRTHQSYHKKYFHLFYLVIILVLFVFFDGISLKIFPLFNNFIRLFFCHDKSINISK